MSFESKLKEFFNDMKDEKKKNEFMKFYEEETKRMINTTKEVVVLVKNKKGDSKIIKAVFDNGKIKAEQYNLSAMDLIFLVHPLLDLITKESLKDKALVLKLYDFINREVRNNE